MENCTHDCSSCGENCPSRSEPESMLFPPHELSSVKPVSYTHLDVYKRQTQKLYDELTGIQYGVKPDPMGWITKL